MTPQQIVALGVRLAALLVGFYSVRFLVLYPVSMRSTNLADQVHISFILGACALLLAIFFWVFPMAIAHRILPRTKYANHLNLPVFEAARVGCSLIGLWFALSVVPGLVWILFTNLVNSTGQSLFRSLSAEDRATFLFYLAELALAVFLIFRSHVFARIVVGKSTPKEEQSRAL